MLKSRCSTNKLSTIVVHTSIYGVGQALRGLSSLILLPIYTTFLSPAEFGLVELLNIVVDLTALLIGSRIGIGIFKYYNEATTRDEKRQVLSTALILICLLNLGGILCLFVLGKPISLWLNAPDGFTIALRVLSINLIISAFNEVFFSFLRLENRPTAYVVTNLLKFIVQFLLNVLFIVYLGLGYWGIILGSLISSVLVSLVFAAWLLPSVGSSFRRSYAVKIAIFSFPIVLSSLGMYYISFGSRYFLKLYHGLEAIGIYALAYKIGLTFFSMVWGPFSTFWTAKQFAYAQEANARQFFGVVFFYANFVLLAGAAAVIVLAPHFLRIVAATEFWPAIELVPWIVCTSILQSWTDYFRIGIFHASKNVHITYGTALTVIAITTLFFWWVPSQGPLGAAKATFVAFLCRFAYFFLIGQVLFKIEVPWRRFSIVLCYFLAVTYVLWIWPLADSWALLVKGLLVVASAALLMVSPAMIPGHRERSYRWISRHLDKFPFASKSR